MEFISRFPGRTIRATHISLVSDSGWPLPLCFHPRSEGLETARAKGMAASEHIRSRFTWAHTAKAVERRLAALTGEHQNQPRINVFQPSGQNQPDHDGHVRGHARKHGDCGQRGAWPQLLILNPGGARMTKAREQFHQADGRFHAVSLSSEVTDHWPPMT